MSKAKRTADFIKIDTDDISIVRTRPSADNQIKRLRQLLQQVADLHGEPCRYDHNKFCQAHYCSEPCLYGEIRKELEA